MRIVACLVAGLALTVMAGAAKAEGRRGFGGGKPGFGGPGIGKPVFGGPGGGIRPGGWHGPHGPHGWHGWNGWRGRWPGVYLDDGYYNGGYGNPGVVIEQTFINAAPPRSYAAPTVLDLPPVLGIRDVKPDQPSVYVLQDRGTGFAGPRGGGAKIIELGEGGMAEPERTGSIAAAPRAAGGAKIIEVGIGDPVSPVASDVMAGSSRIITLKEPVSR